MEHTLTSHPVILAGNQELLLVLCACMLVISFLYSTVGHAGASGYLAIMSLFGLAPGFIKPVALICLLYTSDAADE